MTGLTNGFSKKWAKHHAQLALHFASLQFRESAFKPKSHPRDGSGNNRSYMDPERVLVQGIRFKLFILFSH